MCKWQFVDSLHSTQTTQHMAFEVEVHRPSNEIGKGISQAQICLPLNISTQHFLFKPDTILIRYSLQYKLTHRVKNVPTFDLNLLYYNMNPQLLTALIGAVT